PTEEPTEEPAPEPEAPLFSRGYARADAGTAVYGSESLGEKIGTLTERSVVYAYDREGDGEGDPLAIAFATADGVVTGYVRARDVEPLDESYADGLYSPWDWNGFPLEEVSFAPMGEEILEPVEEPTEVCECYTEVGERVCAEDCACPCHLEEVPLEPEVPLESEAPLGAELPPEEPPEAPEPPAPVILIYAEPNPVIIGEEVTLFAVPENIVSAIWQWQYSADDVNWINIEGANALSYAFKSDAENIRLYYRMLALDPIPEPAVPEPEPEPEPPEPPEAPEPLPPDDEPAAPEETGGGDILAQLGALLFPSAIAESGNFVASGSLLLGSLGEPAATIVETGELYISLPDAVDAAEGGQTVELLKDVELSETLSIDKALTLISDGSHTISRGGFSWNPLVHVEPSGALTLGGGGTLTLDGKGGGYYVVRAGGGALTMLNGVIITGSDTGGVYNSGGTFTMSGGAIQGNHVYSDGAGVINGNGGTFTMSGGTIRDNKATSSHGGGVLNEFLCTFTMTGGTIEENDADRHGGGVRNDGVFTMSGGTISGNEADGVGGGVYSASGTFTLSGGGKITGNSADGGSGVYVSSTATFNMEGGSISGNKGTGFGGGVRVEAFAIFDMSGGSISGNSASFGGGGVYEEGLFQISGGAVISDELYLCTDSMIVVGPAFTGSARVRPDAYTPGRQILWELPVGQTYDLLTRTAFAIPPNAEGNWMVDENGELAAASYVARVTSGGDPDGTLHTNLLDAINDADDRPMAATVMLINDAVLTAPAIIEDNDVTLESVGAAHRITRAFDDGPMFVAASNFSLRGDSADLVIDGGGIGGTNNNIVLVASGGTFDMGSGVTLRGGRATEGAGVRNNGDFTMNGGTISGCASTYGGGVNNTDRFTMLNGTISSNSASSGGGVSNSAGGEFALVNGTISGNGAGWGGGVYNTGADTKFTMSGGTIARNTSNNFGGGVDNRNGAAFTLSGGTICFNEAAGGGGVDNRPDSAFTMTAGEISENSGFGNGLGLLNEGTFAMSGGTICGNPGTEGVGVYTKAQITLSNTAAIEDGVWLQD
ncbi:MAG: hypothetical protein GX592_14000, partial [Clostridiales bacterium]|nr:hypothetical protein [Clostridiales bacterium]